MLGSCPTLGQMINVSLRPDYVGPRAGNSSLIPGDDGPNDEHQCEDEQRRDLPKRDKIAATQRSPVYHEPFNG